MNIKRQGTTSKNYFVRCSKDKYVQIPITKKEYIEIIRECVVKTGIVPSMRNYVIKDE